MHLLPIPPAIARGLVLLHCVLCLSVSALGAEALTSTKQVRELSREVAADRLPVHLRGVVTFSYPGAFGGFVIHTGETGIFVSRSGSARAIAATPGARATVAPGALVEVVGVTGPGGYAPTILPSRITALGAAELPEPIQADLSSLLTGVLDCQRVELSGVIHSAELLRDSPDRMRFTLALPAYRFSVSIIDPGEWTPERLIGARVRVRGVCSTLSNYRGETLGMRLLTTDLSEMEILTPAPADPFAVPEAKIRQLLPFSPHGPQLLRQRVLGTVALSRSGRFLYIEEDERGVRINTRDPKAYQPGDRVEASGFVAVVGNFAEMNEAIIRKTGVTPAPVPVPVTREMVMKASTIHRPPRREDFNGRLVSLTGTFEREERSDTGLRQLVFLVEGRSLSTTLEGEDESTRPPGLRAGSEARIAGVCEVQFTKGVLAGEFPEPTDFSLLLRSWKDVEVLRAASWWTPAILRSALSGTAVVLILAISWVILLRRRVTAQTALIRQQLAKEAVHEERMRMARELHDVLEQQLTGVSLQVDTAAGAIAESPADAVRNLETAQALLRHTRAETRRSIWELRAATLERGDLVAAVREMVEDFSGGQASQIQVTVLGVPVSLPVKLETNLLRITTEAVTNAVKHAQATSIEITIRFEPGEVFLHIEDNGIGLDQARMSMKLSGGHFGLLGMRERAEHIGARLELRGGPGKGMEVLVAVKLPPDFVASPL